MVKIFTHKDTDGVVAALIVSKYYQVHHINNILPDIDVEFLDAGKVDKPVLDFLHSEEISKYSHCYILDLSFSKEETADEVEKYLKGSNLHLEIIDHHVSAKWLNAYEYATVVVEEGSILQSASSLVAKRFTDSLPSKYLEMATLARSYDTWDWVKTNNERAHQLDQLVMYYNVEVFYKMHIRSSEREIFAPFDKDILNVLDARKEQILHQVDDNLLITQIEDYSYAIYLGNKCTNDVAEYIRNNYRNVDVIALANLTKGSISLRSNQPGLEVNGIAEKFNGGGHAYAAGFRIDKRPLLKLVAAIIACNSQEEIAGLFK